MNPSLFVSIMENIRSLKKLKESIPKIPTESLNASKDI